MTQTVTRGVFTVTISADDSYVTGNILRALLLIGGVALVAVGIAVVLGLLYAKRLLRPLEELAGAADRLGSGDSSPLGRRYGIQELDRVAEGLDGSAQRINELLAAEREFSIDASHQLRTPLTALSMRLEEMVGAADDPAVVREEGAAALAQTERLAEVVGQLLGRARRSASSAPIVASVDEIVGQQVVEWEPAFRRINRRLAVTGEKGLLAFATPGGASQVIATLLDNALVHGAGTVTIRTSRTRRSVVVEVRDEGSGVLAGDRAADLRERSVSGAPGGTGVWGWRWPAPWPRPTAARWSWSGRARPCSPCSSRTGRRTRRNCPRWSVRPRSPRGAFWSLLAWLAAGRGLVLWPWPGYLVGYGG